MWLSEIGGTASDVLTLYVIITPFDLEDVRYSENKMFGICNHQRF